MFIQSLLVHTFLIIWFVCSIALFYWVGLVLEAFQLSAIYGSLCRLICAVWCVSTIVIWASYRRRSLSVPRSPRSLYLRIPWYLYLLGVMILDLGLFVQGVRVGSGWLLIPITHLIVSYLMNFRSPSH